MRPMLDLRDRVALVTGGGTGIGFEVSSRLAAAGAHLAIPYGHSRAEAEAAAERLRATGARVLVRQTDLAQVDAIEALVEAVLAEYDRVDLVVNCAGTTRFVPWEDLDGVTEAVWDELMAVNLKAPFFVSRAAARWMRAHDGGAIVNVASTAGIRPGGSSLPYAVSKAGVIHLTRSLAHALAPQVRVNGVAPGMVLTRWWTARNIDYDPVVQSTRFKRGLDAGEVADAVLLLLRNESISGQTLTVDLANVFY
jgi:3-oxoacyl-[acyl-carrier protein] reductase